MGGQVKYGSLRVSPGGRNTKLLVLVVFTFCTTVLSIVLGIAMRGVQQENINNIKKLNAAEKSVTSLKATLETTKAGVATASKRVEEVQAEIKSLQEKLNTANSAVKQADSRSKQLERDLEHAMQRQKDAQQDADRAQENAATQTAKAASLEVEMNKLQSKLAKLTAANTNTNKTHNSNSAKPSTTTALPATPSASKDTSAGQGSAPIRKIPLPPTMKSRASEASNTALTKGDGGGDDGVDYRDYAHESQADSELAGDDNDNEGEGEGDYIDGDDYDYNDDYEDDYDYDEDYAADDGEELDETFSEVVAISPDGKKLLPRITNANRGGHIQSTAATTKESSLDAEARRSSRIMIESHTSKKDSVRTSEDEGEELPILRRTEGIVAKI